IVLLGYIFVLFIIIISGTFLPFIKFRSTSTPKGWYQGHSFVKKNLHKPATCHHCSDLLWGILGTTGMVCEVCNFLAHEKCMRVVVTACTCIAPFLTKVSENSVLLRFFFNG
ncbi:unnamed protein product, partial [Trichobilharzia regenti]